MRDGPEGYLTRRNPEGECISIPVCWYSECPHERDSMEDYGINSWPNGSSGGRLSRRNLGNTLDEQTFPCLSLFSSQYFFWIKTNGDKWRFH